MEMGKLTAKLRDAVPVCFMVEDKEIKRYRNIDIPDELKMLEYQDFKFDVPTTGTITFKISFAPGVLPEEFPKDRERRTRTSKDEPVVAAGEMSGVAPREEVEISEAANIEASNEATQETTACIIINEAPTVEITESAPPQEIIGGLASLTEVQATVEVIPEAKAEPKADSEPEANDANPAQKAAAKPKKAPGATKGSKE